MKKNTFYFPIKEVAQNYQVRLEIKVEKLERQIKRLKTENKRLKAEKKESETFFKNENKAVFPNGFDDSDFDDYRYRCDN